MSTASNDDKIVEEIICQVDDLQNNQMKQYDVGNYGKVLLVKENDQFSALGPKCTHYGAPLANGVLSNGKIRCQWHGACFNSKTGDIEDFPGLDSLPKYEVKVVGNNVVIKTTKNALKNAKRVKSMCKRDISNCSDVLIVGGGPAALTCAETLRQEGFTGLIKMISNEEHSPYDRTKLSKSMDANANSILLRNSEFFKNSGIEIMNSKEAKCLNCAEKYVELSNGETLKFNQLVIATGGRPNVPKYPGLPLENVFILRTPNDANKICESAQNKHVVILGTSFIGMEAASFLSDKAASVNVIGRNPLPFQNVFGDQIGFRFKMLFEENGVKFYLGVTVNEFIGKDGKLSEVLLSNGSRLQADICIIGLGVVPNTEFIKSSSVSMNKNGYVIVDKNMKTSVPGIYAVGDVVEFPLALANNLSTVIGHWQMAQAHGRIAALNIMKKCEEINSVPYFWSMLYKRGIRFAGFNEGFDDLIIDGSLDDLKFAAYFCKEDRVVALLSMARDPIVSQFASLLASGRILKKEDVRQNPEGWIKFL